MVTAAGGVTVVAPGGTKFVDFQFNKLGGLSSETYGTKLDNFSFKTEVSAIALTARGVNLQAIGVDNKKAQLYLQIAAIALSIAQGVRVSKAPAYLSNSDIEIHT